MPKRTGNFDAWRLQKLTDPENAAIFLNAALQDSLDIFLEALGDVVQARNVSAVAKTVGMARESIYRSFSLTGNPTLDKLGSVLGAVGLKIKIVVDSVDESFVADRRLPGLKERRETNSGTNPKGLCPSDDFNAPPESLGAFQAFCGKQQASKQQTSNEWGPH